MVRLDVSVADAAGRPLLDLRASEFELDDEGARQTVERELLRATDVVIDDAGTSDRATPDQRSEARASGGRLLAFLLDEYHVAPGDESARVRDTLRRFVEEELRPSDLVVVFKPLDSLRSIRLTRERAALKEVIEGFEGRLGDFAPRTAFETSYMSREPVALEAMRVQVVASAMQALVSHMGALRRGRKALVVVTRGFTGDVSTPRDQTPGGLQPIARAANRLGVTISSLDPSAAGPDATSDPPRALDRLAAETGGRVVRGLADWTTALREVSRMLDAYYLLTYRSPHAADGRFHAVSVRVTRPHATVTVRAGYVSASAADRETSEWLAARADAAASKVPAKAQHRSPFIRPWLGVSRGADGRTRVTFTWEPEPMRGGRRAADSLTLRATTEEGTVLFEGPVAPARAGAAESVPVSQRAVFDLAPGRLNLEMAIADASRRALDTDVRAVTVPSLVAGPTVIATPEVYRARTAREFNAIRANPSAAPATSRDFGRPERLLVRIAAYSGAEPATRVTAVLQNALGHTMRDLAPRPSTTVPGSVEIDLSLMSLAPGDYRIEFFASGPGGEARDVMTFRVAG